MYQEAVEQEQAEWWIQRYAERDINTIWVMPAGTFRWAFGRQHNESPGYVL